MAQFEGRHRLGLIPVLAPVRRRARRACSPSRDTKRFDGEGFFLLHHVVNGSSQLVGQDRKGLGLTMFFSKLLDVAVRGRVGAKKEHGGFGESPLQVDVSNLCAAGSESFTRGAFLAFDESSIGGEVLDALEAGDIVDLVEQGHGEDLADAVNGAESEEVTRVMDFGLSSEKELEVPDT